MSIYIWITEIGFTCKVDGCSELIQCFLYLFFGLKIKKHFKREQTDPLFYARISRAWDDRNNFLILSSVYIVATNPCDKSPCHKSAMCLRTTNNKFSCVCRNHHVPTKLKATGPKVLIYSIYCLLETVFF